jgi:transposase-like protein
MIELYPSNPTERAAVFKFYADLGFTTTEAANLMQVASVTVRKWARALGVTFQPDPSPIRRFHAGYMIVAESGCWIWTKCVRSEAAPYGVIVINGKNEGAHRFSYMNYKGEIPEGMQICHRCDTPSCVNPDHLFLGTAADNARDKIAKRRHNSPKGDQHHAAKITDGQVVSIRLSPLSISELARIYDVSPSTICKIRKGVRRAS